MAITNSFGGSRQGSHYEGSTSCPYGAEPCPKIEDCYRDIARMHDQIQSVSRLLYIVIGVMTVQLGFSFI